MSKGKNTIAHAKALKTGEPNISVVMPKTIANSISVAMQGGEKQPLVYDEQKEAETAQPSWYMVEDLSNTIRNAIATTANSINDVVTMVAKTGYVEGVTEYTNSVQVAMRDLEHYSEEWERVRARHAGKNGFIKDKEEYVEYMSVFEDYQSLSAFFEGVMHHKLIEFTEYALSAQDHLKNKVQEEENNQQEEGVKHD